MKTFLQEVVQDLLSKNTDFSQIILVIPGKRPVAFFKKTFSEAGYHGILPQFLTIEDLLTEITSLQLISGIPLLFQTFLANIYSTDNEENFEDFLKWAPTLLKDFDDIDSSLANAKSLFTYLISEERIRKWGVNNLEIGLSELMKNHLGFWTEAEKIYHLLNENLNAQKQAYRGMLARKAVEKVEDFQVKNTKNFVFVGFNAFTKAEEKIVESLIETGKAKVYWDADEYYLKNKTQEAGDFLRNYSENPFLGKDFKFSHASFIQEKKLRAFGIPKQVGQAKFTGQLLKKMSAEERAKTAVVLADEKLLPAVLNSLPNEVETINITMGLPLNNVPMSQFFVEVFQMFVQKEKLNSQNSFYYKNVLNLLDNSIFGNYFLPQKRELKKKMIEQNLIFVNEKELNIFEKENQNFCIFSSAENPRELVENLIFWLNQLHENHKFSAMELEFLFRFRSLFIQLKDWLEKYDFVENFKVLNQLFIQILQIENIAFLGEPLVGLQLLGMLETRLLDFENVILCSVNEGILPLGRQENTFIPFDIRAEAGLNTFLVNDSIYAYHFYHLIQRCESATFLYNTESEGLISSELSRFLMQLDWESPHELEMNTASPTFTKPEMHPISIEKTEEFIQKWKEKLSTGISPSALRNFILNPIQFYQNVILGLRTEDEVEENAGSQTIGQVVHDALFQLYHPLKGKILHKEDFDKLKLNYKTVVNEAFRVNYLKSNEIKGKNILILNVSEAFVASTLEKDLELVLAGNELVINELEKTYFADYQLQNGEKIKFKGIIDRIDSMNGNVRILDYKTGSIGDYDYSLKSTELDKLIENKEKSKSIQLILYAYLFLQNHEQKNVTVGALPMRYFSKNHQNLSIDGNEEISENLVNQLLIKIEELIEIISNPEIPLQENED